METRIIKLDDYSSNRSKKLFELKQKNPDVAFIFEDWILYKKDIIDSIIDIKNGIYDKKYYARKLEIKNISSKELKEFLEANHLQGNCVSSIRYGLFNNEELVQVMSFSKVRYTKKAEYELTRLATKKRTIVVGGTEKLFKHFIKEYNNPSIVSYCDNSIFSGNIYSKLGFVMIKNEPGYCYYGKDKKRQHRSLFQKHKLAKKFNISESSVSTEYETCINNGFKRIWDCGQSTWIYNDLSMEEKIQKNICEKYNITFIDKFNTVFSKQGDLKVYTKYNFKCNRCGYVWKQGIRFDRNLSCPICFPVNHGSSKGELELYNYFLTTGLKVEHNNRTVLEGKELDIYIPELNVGIEYDGAYWHNKLEDDEKNALCKEKNIKLYRVDNDEWNYNSKKILFFFSKELNITFKEIDKITTLSDKSQKVIDLSTLKVYDSAKEAAADIGLKEYGNINNVCNGNLEKIDGRKFAYYEDGKEYKKIERKKNYKTKAVRCIEDNIIYESYNEAVRQTGIKTIWDCLNGRQKTAGKKHWEYVN